MTRRRTSSLLVKGILLCLVISAGCSTERSPTVTVDSRQFLPFTDLSTFQKAVLSPHRVEWVSPPLRPAVAWNELVLCWNLQPDAVGQFTFEAGPILAPGLTEYFLLGTWSSSTAFGERTSINGQSNEVGQVATDILQLSAAARDLRIRIIWESAYAGDQVGQLQRDGAPSDSPLKLLGVSLLNTQIDPGVTPPNRDAWGIHLPVQPLCQLDYAGGNAWCSPTALSMLLSYWQAEIAAVRVLNVPTVATEVFDPGWSGTGNWSFNVAYAGGLPGMRAFVDRLTGMRELEGWIEAGIPVAVSVSYSLLRGAEEPSDGHFLVCTGFTETGDIRVNDPGSKSNPQPVIERSRFARAWAFSHFTAYLVFPESVTPPTHRLGHR